MLNPQHMSNTEFIDKLLGDIDKLTSCGFSEQQAKSMVARLDYVRDFIDTPDWLEISDKLPKGYKWSTGQKFFKKSSKKNDSETYVFLEIGSDLYMKGILDIYGIAWSENTSPLETKTYFRKIKNDCICLIKDWKRISETEARKYLGNTAFLDNAISQFWFKNNERSSIWKKKR